jgi:hypothetical protein
MKGYHLLKEKFISMKFATCVGWLTEPKYSNFYDFGWRMLWIFVYTYTCEQIVDRRGASSFVRVWMTDEWISTVLHVSASTFILNNREAYKQLHLAPSVILIWWVLAHFLYLQVNYDFLLVNCIFFFQLSKHLQLLPLDRHFSHPWCKLWYSSDC